MISRTTITASDKLMDRVNKHIAETGETLTSFINRALLNQLEKDGDFEIRDIVEVDENARKE